MKLNPGFGLAAATLLLAGAGGAALAHPHPDDEGDGRKVERILVIDDGKDGEHHAKGDRVHRFVIRRGGEHHAGGPAVRRFEMRGPGGLVDCDGGEKVVEENADEDGKKTKVIICTRGGDRPTAATAERIEKALARIRDHDELSDEQKARIETALRSAMERARGAR